MNDGDMWTGQFYCCFVADIGNALSNSMETDASANGMLFSSPLMGILIVTA